MRQTHATRVSEAQLEDAPEPSPTDETRGAGAIAADADAHGPARTNANGQAASAAHAVAVETIFAGQSIVTRLLPAARESRRARTATVFLVVAGALIALALALFAIVAIDVGAERQALLAWTAAGHVAAAFAWRAHTPAAGLLDAAFVLSLLGGGLLTAFGLQRRADGRRYFRRTFSIGSGADADAPVDQTFIPTATHTLVSAAGDDYLLHPTACMTGTLEVGDARYPIGALLAHQGASLRLPPGARARLVCDRTTFVIRSIRRPTPLPKPWFRINANDLSYTAGAALALALFVIMIFTIPPDPRSLSLDLFDGERHLVSFHIAPPAESIDPLPKWLTGGQDQANAQPAAPRAAGPQGAPGDRRAPDRDRRASHAPERRLTEQQSLENVRNGGILGVLRATRGTSIAEVLQPGSAFGDSQDAEDVVGHLAGTEIGDAWGAGGLIGIGSGSGGGGTGEGIRGVGRLRTLGKHGGGGPGNGSGYDRGVGGLGGRRARVPEITVGEASVRGSLDKEIIRRIIHRHINEIRFCYEQELPKQPRLGGRVGVQFMISGAGKVISSVLQSSTVGNRSVENCTVQAVRRWEFPQPLGGGMVVVSYPFLFAQPL